MLQFYLVDILRHIQNPLVLVQGRDTRAESQESRRKKSCIQHLESKSLKRQSRSSAGQSATLIMQRSAVRACPRLLIEGCRLYKVQCTKYLRYLIHYTQYKNTPLEGNQLSWLERLPCTQEVKGSTPLFSTVLDV